MEFRVTLTVRVFFGVDGQSFGFQPAFDPLADLRALSRRTEHDEIVGVSKHAVARVTLSIDLVIQGIEIDVRQ